MANLPKDRLNVFGYTYANRGRLNDDFRAACTKAEITYGRYDGVTPHSLRHTFATWLRQKGWDLKAVQDLGRWKDIKSVARYAHVSSAEQKKAINGLPVQKARNAKKRTAK